MADEIHSFTITSAWTGESSGDGTLGTSGVPISYGLPQGLGGASGRTNPEELLMSSIAACYSITLAVLAERRKLPISRIELAVEGDVVRQAGGTLKFVAIRLKPRITLNSSDDAQIKIAEDFAHKAEQYCLISNAVRGNVELSVDPEISSAV
jgi:peroxiredoxin-like protein